MSFLSLRPGAGCGCNFPNPDPPQALPALSYHYSSASEAPGRPGWVLLSQQISLDAPNVNTYILALRTVWLVRLVTSACLSPCWSNLIDNDNDTEPVASVSSQKPFGTYLNGCKVFEIFNNAEKTYNNMPKRKKEDQNGRRSL